MLQDKAQLNIAQIILEFQIIYTSIDRSGSRTTNVLLNLISRQLNANKIYLYAKDQNVNCY